MPQGTVAIRDAEKVREYTADFVTRKEHFLSSARLDSALHWPARAGGGRLRFSYDAQRDIIDSLSGELALTNNNIGDVDFGVTGNGGPYIDLDGATEYYNRAQGAFSDIGANSFAVWCWAAVGATPATPMTITGVWGAAGDRQWRLIWDAGPGPLAWIYSDDGTAGFNLGTSHANPSVGEWFFLGGYFTPSAADGQRTYFALATEDTLTIDDLGGGNSQAQIFTGGTADFMIGNQGGVARYWNGEISGIGARTQLALANADAFFKQKFAETQTIYQ
jgi:hypothetical protein